MPNAEKARRGRRDHRALHELVRCGHHRVPRTVGQAGDGVASRAGPRHDLRGREEHPDRRAAAEAGVALDESLLVGPTAIAFVSGDPVEAAKGLRDFARTNPLLVIKGGILDGKSLSAAEIGRIADLESREVLLAKLAGALKALPTRAAGLFQAPLTQMARWPRRWRRRSLLQREAPVAEAAAPTPRHPRAEASEIAAPCSRRRRPPTTSETPAAEQRRTRPKLPPSRRSKHPIDRRLIRHVEKGRQSWRSSALTSCSTASRR